MGVLSALNVLKKDKIPQNRPLTYNPPVIDFIDYHFNKVLLGITLVSFNLLHFKMKKIKETPKLMKKKLSRIRPDFALAKCSVNYM